MGIDRWIQGITGWVDPSLQPPAPSAPPPLPDLCIPRQAIDILKNPNVLSANGYRLYLQLHEADILNRRPSAADICRDLDITLPTYYKALNLLEQFGILPTWIVTKKRRQRRNQYPIARIKRPCGSGRIMKIRNLLYLA